MPTIDGIVSGIDTTGLINAIIEAEASQQRAMEAQRDELTQRRERVAALSNRLQGVSTAIDAIDAPEDWAVSTVTSSENTQFTATVDEDAAPGTYAIRVDALATAQVTASGGFADRVAPGTIAHGTFDVDVGGTVTTITIDATNDSLADMAALINEVDGVTAYTVNTGAATDPWRLVIQADETGTAGTFSLDTTGLTGGTGSVPTFTDEVTAVDASVEVNGITILSSENTLRGVVPGIDLQLDAVGTGTELLSVGEDREALVERIQGFVDAYNDAVSYYKQQSFFNPDTGNRGPLAGDGTARRAISRLGTLVSGSYTVADSTFAGLSQLGFSTQRDGTLQFDSGVLEDALDADLENVQAFFTDPDGPLAALRSEIDDVQVDSENGALTSRTESLKESVEGYEERIEDFQQYLDDYAQRLRDQFTNMELTLGRLQGAQAQLASLFASIGGGQQGQ
jgi:flagellar hook-associated protein 2